MDKATDHSGKFRQAFFDKTQESLAIFDKDLNFIDVNEALLRSLSFKKEQIIGKHVSDISPGIRETKRYKLYLQVMQSGETVTLDEVNMHPTLGSFVSRVSIFKVGDGLGLAALNITDLKHTIDKLETAKKELGELNESLEELVDARTTELSIKNKDLTDSIKYAKRIQESKLTPKKEIYASFPESFILSKPKDIVSGDFYYFHKKEHTAFIAAADCTGHGVPGALMSMLCSEKLEDVVVNHSDPSDILNQLHQKIKTSLRQSEDDGSGRDGMDIALCCVDQKNRILTYSGANRPLWLIRNGQASLEEIKGTKKAIGGFTNDSRGFDGHTLKLQPGDTFYIFSDGYADTFGGEDGKKLMTKKFKEILLKIQHLPMNEQEVYLEDFIETWKAEIEQVDDILVVGVRM
jgi:PAS domain S-box-containing protein